MTEERIIRWHALNPVRLLQNVMEPLNQVVWCLPGPVSSVWASFGDSYRGWRGISRICWGPRQWWHDKSGNSPSPISETSWRGDWVTPILKSISEYWWFGGDSKNENTLLFPRCRSRTYKVRTKTHSALGNNCVRNSKHSPPKWCAAPALVAMCAYQLCWCRVNCIIIILIIPKSGPCWLSGCLRYVVNKAADASTAHCSSLDLVGANDISTDFRMQVHM